MKELTQTRIILLAGSLLGLIVLWGAVIVCGQNTGSKIHVPEGVYIELTKDFYEALRDEGSKGTNVYTNDPSVEYLKKISISARFMVETNIQTLKQQEKTYLKSSTPRPSAQEMNRNC